MNDFAMLSLYGVFFVGLALIVLFVLYLNREHHEPRHPAPGE
jgi:hypothetical protein